MHRFLGLIALVGCVGWSGSLAAEILTTATGYRLHYSVYEGSGPAALIFMHGKNGANESLNNKTLADRLARAGTTVYLPSMPWSRSWDGTADDATSALDALVDLAAKDGKKVFVGGQSMGAMFTITYRAGDLPPAVVGKIATSPGGLLDLIKPGTSILKAYQPSVEKARALEASGKGKTKTRFEGTNVSGEKNIEEVYDTTPEIYLSFHDVERAPSVRRGLVRNNVPFFWSRGTKDPIGNAGKRTFDLMPANPASLYIESNGDHNSNMLASIDPIIGWIKARTAP